MVASVPYLSLTTQGLLRAGNQPSCVSGPYFCEKNNETKYGFLLDCIGPKKGKILTAIPRAFRLRLVLGYNGMFVR